MRPTDRDPSGQRRLPCGEPPEAKATGEEIGEIEGSVEQLPREGRPSTRPRRRICRFAPARRWLLRRSDASRLLAETLVRAGECRHLPDCSRSLLTRAVSRPPLSFSPAVDRTACAEQGGSSSSHPSRDGRTGRCSPVKPLTRWG